MSQDTQNKESTSNFLKNTFKDNLVQFVLLFAAVTLGFFAENQREHYVEGHREIQFMESLMDDLAKDKIEVNSAREYTTTQISNLDTAISLLSKNNWTSENIKIFYRVSLKTGGNRPMTFIDKTSSQLKSGGMRLIRDKEVSRLITEYWQLIAQLNEFESQTIFMYKANIKNMAYKIIDGTKYIDVKNKIIGDDAQLITSDRTFLAEYNNRLINLRFDLNKFLIEFAYTRLDKKINELQTEIAIKYNLGYKRN
jgi:hypothetical protein